MSAIYIDEAAGSDVTGQGSKESPYQSLALAVYKNGGESAQANAFQIRKSAEVEYEEPTQSSLKKAKKNAAGIEKKLKKEKELAEREAKEKGEEKERKEKLLEESKKIILEEDASLPKAVRVSLSHRILFANNITLYRRKFRNTPNCE